jgi:hypothetical protein
MAIMVNCTCGQVLSVDDQFAGKTVMCSQCQRVVPVPAVGPAMAAGGDQPAVNPYAVQNAGYAAAAAPQGYNAPPAQYYSPEALGKRAPSRGLLIAGGVLAILGSTFIMIGALALVGMGEALKEMLPGLDDEKIKIMQTAGGIVALIAVVGIIMGAITCASKGWAALTSGIIQAIFLLLFLLSAAQNPQPAVFFFIIVGGLATVFNFIGVGQARAFKAYRGHRPA